jgi:predicted RNA-binding Zn-ribbon protein involved in translation (DUF1610 family)
MENVMKKEIGEEFYICEKCTYERGFHVSLTRYICEKCTYERGFHVSLTREGTHHEIVLICPNCGQRYSVGWRLTLTQNT